MISSFIGVWLGFQTFTARNYYYYYYYYYYCRMMFFMSRWSFDFLYNQVIFQSLLSLLHTFYYFLDKGLIEYLGPTGAYRILASFSQRISLFQTGSLTLYIQVLAGCLVCGLCCFPLLLQWL